MINSGIELVTVTRNAYFNTYYSLHELTFRIPYLRYRIPSISVNAIVVRTSLCAMTADESNRFGNAAKSTSQNASHHVPERGNSPGVDDGI